MNSCTAHNERNEMFYCSEGAFQNMICLSIKSLHGGPATYQPFLSFMASCGCHLPVRYDAIYIYILKTPSKKEHLSVHGQNNMNWYDAVND